MEIKIEYDPLFFRSVYRTLWRDLVRRCLQATPPFLLGVALLILAVSWLLTGRADTTHTLQVLVAVAVGVAVLLGVQYVLWLRPGRLNDIASELGPVTTFRFTDTGIDMSQGVETTHAEWSAVTTLREFPTFWQIIVRDSPLFYLPTAQIPCEVARYVERNVRDAGGRVIQLSA